MSADEELGYVYLPTTSVTNDMYGGHRRGNNLFSDSIVCIDARTGRRVWYYQTVHHDLFDFFDLIDSIIAAAVLLVTALIILAACLKPQRIDKQ